MLYRLWQKIKYYQLPILSGFFIGTSFIPFPPWASLFALVPLWIFWQREKSLKRIFIGGWITQFILTLIGFNWVAFLAHEFGRMPWVVSIIVLFLYAGLTNLYIPLAGLVWGTIKQRQWLTGNSLIWALPPLIYLFEIITPTVFPWNYGYTWMWANMPLFQWAEYIGFTGLSFITLLLQLGLFFFWRNRKNFKPLFLSLGLFALMNLVGIGIKKAIPEPDKKANVIIVQANIGNLEKVYAEQGWGFQDHIKSRYFELTSQAVKKAAVPIDFVIWPETAYPNTIGHSPKFQRETESLGRFVRDLKIDLVAGAYSRGPKTGKATNSIFVLDHSGILQKDFYTKNKLLVFGEFIPGAETFPKLKQWIPAGDFESGHGPVVLPLKTLKLGPQICYESLFPHLTRSIVNLGAHMIVNVTNDSWYGKWQEPYQHMYMTMARAVEYRRPLIRSTNTGISTVGLADGTVMQTSPLHKEWTGLYEIPYWSRPLTTFYQKYYWLMPALAILAILGLLGKARFERPKDT